MIKDIEFILKKIFFSQRYLLEKRLKRAIANNYEKELKLIEKFSDKSKDAIDVGVYRGVYSYKLSQYFKMVHSFEPNPLLYPYIENNLQKIIKNIKLYNLALSNINGNTELKLPIRSKSIFKSNIEELFKLGAASIHPDNKLENFKKVSVKMQKLDNIKINNEIGFIKIDVEGHEENVILGSSQTIKRNKPVMLIEIEERHTQKPIINTINLIKEYGYNAYILRENNNDLIDITKVNNFSNERNFFFIKK